jgi:hypothetical protein
MGGRGSDAWALVPDDIKEMLKDLPDEQIETVLSKLVQASTISYRELTEQDVATIKVPAPAPPGAAQRRRGRGF